VVTPTVVDPGFHAEWTARARTLLAETVAKGLPAEEILQTCRSVLDNCVFADTRRLPVLLVGLFLLDGTISDGDSITAATFLIVMVVSHFLRD
jgi:hypothetical protein